jgi:glycosyltransferase involved in cell wall biosynthesis
MSEVIPPLVSIVIPSYNHARYLGRALQSVLDQTYTNWEVIVIDNHSTDNTDEVMASFVDHRIIYLKIHNDGVIAASRNAGIRTAKGEWVAFLDSDDWWTGDKLQICMGCINNSIDLVYHGMEIVGGPQSFLKRKYIRTWQVKKPALVDLLLRGNPIVNSSVVVRKALLERVGYINESVEMIAAEDYSTWLRIAQLTDQLAYLPHILGYYLIHNQSVSKKDMSIPARNACAPFMKFLSGKQSLRAESNFRFVGGMFLISSGDCRKAINFLIFGLYHGRAEIKIKCTIKLLMLPMYCLINKKS